MRGVPCAPGLQEAGESLWLRGLITQEEFDFDTAPDGWNRESDVFNKHPKYFLAPLDFFFLLPPQTEKQAY